MFDDDEFTAEDLLEKLGIVDYIKPLLEKARLQGHRDCKQEYNDKGLVKIVNIEPSVNNCLILAKKTHLTISGIIVYNRESNDKYIYLSDKGNIVICNTPKEN